MEKAISSTIAYLDYPLAGGYIHNWLVAGPAATVVPDLGRFTGADYKLQIARHYHEPDSGVTETPAETQQFTAGEARLKWNYVRCRDDHYVDLSVFHHETTYLRAWAYAEVVSAAAQGEAQLRTVTCTLTTNGPADVWLNGQHVHRQEHFYHQLPKRVTFDLSLQAGPNTILVRMEQVAARECPYAMALRLGTGEGLSVRLPTAIAPAERRARFERAFNAAHLRQDVFKADEQVAFYWPDDFGDNLKLTVRVQTPGREIFTEGHKTASPGVRAEMGPAYRFPDGAYDLLLMPTPREYYVGEMKVTRGLRCWTMRGRFSEEPYGTLPERSREALVDAAQREVNVFSEIAKMALGMWSRVRLPAIQDTIARINRRGDCSDFYLVGLLGMAYRYAGNPEFPAELRQPLHDCIVNFKYWHDEPGSDAMCYTTENHSILFHTCEVLAGQLYPDEVFTNNGETGRQHRAKGEARALAWLQGRAAHGFVEWDSNCYFEEDTLALTHLLSLAEDDNLAEMATVVLDKMLFTMAVNSFRGVFGSTHGRTYTPHIKSAYNEATSGMSRLLWGMGVFNGQILATVSLACSEYTLSPLLTQIATDRPEELWSRERHTGDPADWRNSGSHAAEVNKVTYKTPDTMLCSAQDWHPGEPGYQQHIWQATLGPEAVVFVTHPTCASEDGSHRPNFWHGNATLPRVVQWKDVLVAVHRLPDDDWMGFTHAFFPAHAFDEYLVTPRWAFARRGDGYVALSAAGGLQWMTDGDNAYRELRSHAAHNVWVCHLGRRALDGTFEEFQQQIQALPVEFGDLSVRLHSLRGDKLAFGWEGPLLLNGAEQPITGFGHYESPYCTMESGADHMDIQYGETVMRLQFGGA